MMPTPVGDDAASFHCFSCFAEIVFETCDDCGFQQSIPSRWHTAFTCGRCGQRGVIPRARLYSTSTKAHRVEGYGYTYPRM
jgi:hypothetical protein